LDTYIREPDRPVWRPTGGVLQGLRLAAESSRDAILLSESPVEELADLLAAAWFFTKAGGLARRLAVASPYPAACWIDPVRAAAVDRVFVVSRANTSCAADLSGLIEVPRALCPALSVQVLADGTLSVCGQGAYRRVLATHHFVSRCFLNWSTCVNQVDAAGGCR